MKINDRSNGGAVIVTPPHFLDVILRIKKMVQINENFLRHNKLQFYRNGICLEELT